MTRKAGSKPLKKRAKMQPDKIHFHASPSDDAQNALKDMERLYGQSTPEDADVIVALGGDGTMLEALHKFHPLDKPIYGMNRGSIGFMLNPYRAENLLDRLANAQSVTLHPLKMVARTGDGKDVEALAFNEVSLLRQERSAAKIGVSVDGVERLPEMICDGILLATPAGSTAYNLSAHGPVIPLSANVLALTPISPFRPRRWRGALLPHGAKVRFEILEAPRRPVSATADSTEVRDVTQVDIWESRQVGVTLLFDPDHNLEERILKEQFVP
ncbi:MAG: NAD kinase [Rhodospirillales bacterium]|nr:NAD kinase [Rhodospirillales bacterium]